MTWRGGGPFLPAGLGAAALSAAIAGQVALDAHAVTRSHDPLYVPDAAVARHVACGLGPAWADWLHLRALIYVSQEFDSVERKYRWLAALYEAITELDPRFLEAYLYGARFLTILRKDDVAAIHLLEKGLRAMPDRWEIRNELGMVWFYDRKDRQKALEVLTPVLRQPDTPPFLENFVLRISEGTLRDLDTLGILHERLTATRDPIVRRALEQQVREHVARFLRARLEAAALLMLNLADIAAVRERMLADTRELRPPFERALATAGAFRYDPATGRVASATLEALQEGEALDLLRRAVDAWREAHGTWPATLAAACEAAGTRVPGHPRPGGSWAYDPDRGTVTSRPLAPAPALDPPRERP